MVGEHRQIRYPGSHLIPILFGHDTRGLRDMSKVVHDPRRQELPHRDAPETGMLSGKVELALSQLPVTEQLQIGGPEASELVEQRCQRAPRVARVVTEPIVWLEAWRWAASEDDSRARDPVGFLPVDQVPEDIE